MSLYMFVRPFATHLSYVASPLYIYIFIFIYIYSYNYIYIYFHTYICIYIHIHNFLNKDPPPPPGRRGCCHLPPAAGIAGPCLLGSRSQAPLRRHVRGWLGNELNTLSWDGILYPESFC